MPCLKSGDAQPDPERDGEPDQSLYEKKGEYQGSGATRTAVRFSLAACGLIQCAYIHDMFLSGTAGDGSTRGGSIGKYRSGRRGGCV